MAESKLVDFFRGGGIKAVTEVVFNPATGSWEMNFKGIEITGPEGSGVSLEINQSDPSIWQIEGVAGGPIKIGGATNVNQVTGAVSGSNLTIEIPIPGGSIKYKIEPGPLLPHPTDPSAAPIPSATFQPQISLGPVSVEFPKSEPISTDDIFDPDVPGSPLSGGMLGNAYGAIRHRQRQLDAQIDAAENGYYVAARHVPVSRDPLVLDLDGDGLELAGASGAVLFDHNADGIKTGTGWAMPDDGFLVRDRNGNGTIDTGREFFGVDTVKSNNTLAIDGFDALRDLDGNGDGFITSADTAFGELRVWQDANQDGISQSGELKTLAELNISSIGVNGTATGPQAGQVINNNTVALSATFTQNGQTHTVGAIDLETNNFFTEFPPEVVDEAGNPVVITEQAKGLPQMNGSGMVRNMQAAASLDSSFANALQTFSETATRDGQRSQLDNLITQWANTADFPGGIFSGGIPPGNLLFSLPAGITVPEYKNLINVLEAFNGSHFYGDALGGPRPTGYAVTTVSEPGTGTLVHQYIINPLPQQVALLQQAYDAIKESVYEGLVVQTRLSSYLDSIDVNLGDAGIAFDTTAMAALLESRRTSDERNALIDLVELHHYAAPTLLASGFDGVPMLRSWMDALAAGSPLRDELLSLGVYAGPASSGSGRSDIYLGDTSANNFNAGMDDDWLDGGAGNDTLHGGAGNDILNGGTGNDILAGGVYDTWNGVYSGPGSDTYLFGRGDGQDTIYDNDGTVGVIDKIIFKGGVMASDVLISRSGDNLVLTIQGTSDQITVAGYFNGDGAGGWAVEEIHFADDPNAAWTVPYIKSRALIGTAGNDALTGYATDDVIVGNDGNDTMSGRAGNDALYGGNGGDSLSGEDGNDLILGGAGGDSLSGGNGNDTLEGGADGDTLQGGAGDDILDGGTGDDILAGGVYDTWNGNYNGAGSDTYLFGLGDGQDTIIDNDTTAGVIDKIVFRAGILPGSVLISRSGDSLILAIQGSSDQITVNGYFNGDGAGGWAIEEVRFADEPNTAWTVEDIKNMALVGGAGNNALTGYATDDVILGNDGNDTISGRAGNDALYGGNGGDSLSGEDGNDLILGEAGGDSLSGGNGNDTLEGGADGDTLQGGAGDDTLEGGTGDDILAGGVYDTWNGNYNGAGRDAYLFGLGDGQDTIIDNDTTAGVIDKIVFKAGILPASVMVSRSGDSLVLKLQGTGDQITVSNYFSGDGAGGWAVEEIRFTDDMNTVWTVADIKSAALVGSAGNDALTGYATDDVIVGNDGNDSISGRAGNDTLYGGNGADTLNGEEGNDTLLGEAGGDSLSGGNGNDTLSGGADGDTLQGGVGDDILDGGTGDDILAGGVYDTWNGNYNGAGSDTYLFGRGDGQDTVIDNDTTAGTIDRIIFKAGVLPGDVQVSRSGDTLVLRIIGTGDQLTVSGYFNGDGAGGWAVEEIRFTDDVNTTWSVANVKNMAALVGGAGNDTLTGYATDDVMAGNDGNDTMSGRAGNDTLYGGNGGDSLSGEDGNDLILGEAGGDSLSGGNGDDTLSGGADGDTLQGGSGNDILDGGTGNDTLAGGVYDTWNGNYNGAGSDSYLFGRGDGQDTIYDNDGTAGVIDKIIFKAGVMASDVLVARSGDNLVLTIQGTSDQITVAGYFNGDGAGGWAIEEIRFTDELSTVWSIENVKLMALTGGSGNDAITGYATDDVMAGNDGNDTMSGRAGNDTLYGGNGGDSLSGEDGNDLILGEAGGDSLSGGNGNDTLSGGADGDTLQGGAGNDILDGGTGNDTLAGGVYDTWNGNYNGAGSDTYRFGLGDGQDTVIDNDTTAGVIDKIVFKAGILPGGVLISRSGDSLVLAIQGASDQITVSNYFSGDGAGGWAVEEIRFADDVNTVWSIENVKLMALTGGSGNDAITGYATDDVMAGNDGNDTISGRAGNDTLYGGNGVDSLSGEDGNDLILGEAGGDSLSGGNGNDTLSGGADGDTLQGGAGNDVLDGGAGNDTLAGGVYDTWNGNYNGAGNDIYRFGLGGGQDTIIDNDGTVGNIDRIEFDAGIAPAGISVTRSGNNLVLRITGTTDTLTVSNYLADNSVTPWSVEEIAFGDGTVWKPADIDAILLNGGSLGTATSGADSLLGNNTSNDTINGLSGNDILRGLGGDDTLAGGTGNDQLFGGTGADTYLFARGDGADILTDTDATANILDTLRFDGGVAADQLWFQQVGLNLEVSVIGTADKVSVSNWYQGAGNHVEIFELANGARLLDSQVQSLVDAMAAFSPPAAGETTLPAGYQANLLPVIAANWQ